MNELKKEPTVILNNFPGYVLVETDPVDRMVQLIHKTCGSILGTYNGANFSDEVIAETVKNHPCQKPVLPAKT